MHESLEEAPCCRAGAVRAHQVRVQQTLPPLLGQLDELTNRQMRPTKACRLHYCNCLTSTDSPHY